MKWILISALVVSSAFALDVNFDRVDSINENILRGNVRVSCNDGGMQRSQTFICDTSNLEGGNYGYLVVTNGSVDADYVKLQTEGSRYIKGAKFDAASGKSTGKFNLWIATVFQRPMLDRGINTIRYKFFKNNQLVLEGTFDVSVDAGYDRSCGYGNYYYGNFCPAYTQACDDFFWRRNYCR